MVGVTLAVIGVMFAILAASKQIANALDRQTQVLRDGDEEYFRRCDDGRIG